MGHNARKYLVLQYMEQALDFYAMHGQFDKCVDLLRAMLILEGDPVSWADLGKTLETFDQPDAHFWVFQLPDAADEASPEDDAPDTVGGDT